jgi:hypothetical protein
MENINDLDKSIRSNEIQEESQIKKEPRAR